MGGGAAIRAAGKVTGMGVFNSGLRRGISAAQPAEQALSNVSRSAAAVLSTASSPGADVAAKQKVSSWEAEWDYGAMEEDLMVEPAPEPISRAVFDVPSTQETKDATADLKEVLDKFCLSSSDSSGSKLAPVSSSAFSAFTLLRESPAVQSVVASIAADDKVWDSVMGNNDVKEFMVSQRNNAAIEDQESHRMFDESSSVSSPGGDTEDGKDGLFQNIKKSLVDMVSNVSDFFQNLFGSSPAEGTSADAVGAGGNAGGAGESFNEKTMGVQLMGLVIMVIMLVVLKRV